MNGVVVSSNELFPDESDIKNYYMTSPRTVLCLTNENDIFTLRIDN